MAAFQRALQLGADGFEFDVQLTSDGTAVVMHDAMLDRTTDGSGPLFENDFETIRRLDAGSTFGSEFAGEAVPSLREVLQLPARIFELEIKTWGRALLDAVLAEVDEAGVFERVKFTGWNHSMLCALKSERPDATVGLFSFQPQPWMNEAVFEYYVLGTAETAGFDVAHVYAGAITPSIADKLRDLGYVVHANDARGREDVERALAAGVDSLALDDVALAMSIAR
jgi:glycerophosphoryl diester phosphodiesterase